MSACSILVKRQYRKRYDKVETYVRLLLGKKYHFQCSNKWYKHTYTHTHTHTHTHTQITNHNQFVSTSKIEYQIIDFAIFGDRNMVIKEQEKIDKYQVLIIELQKVWNVKVVVIPVVIGALGENR